MHTTLIDAASLAALFAGGGDVLVCDCRFDLTDAQAGARAFDEGHIRGAVHVDLDRDLCGTKTGRNGRHPLPERGGFAARMAALGAGDATQIVAYDAQGGMYAARLWWMLRWAGHEAAAVLDGGWQGWQAWQASQAASRDIAPAVSRPPGGFSLREPLAATIGYDALRAATAGGKRVVLDARSPDRFCGENETLDPIGGHIPGARNRFFRDNLGPDGRFKPAETLRAEFAAATGGAAAATMVAQCGSGVTACHNLLALEIAGLGGATLYPGSWSEWSSRPGAPIAMGAG